MKDSMNSKEQHELFVKFYILYLLTKKISSPIVQKFYKLIKNKKFFNLMKSDIYNEEIKNK